MKNVLESARTIAHVLINHHDGEITDQVILDAIEKTKPMFIDNQDNLVFKELFEILHADFSVGKGSITELHDNIEPWLKSVKADIKFELWNRYKLNLTKSDPSFPINDLDDFTDKILDKCVNPKQTGSWDRRGMVVGHVQSGKTANYVGLINKATDAGYKVIIVLAGTISSLRRQTQLRLDSGYIGRSSSAFIRNKGENKIIGVGNYRAETEIYSLTSSYYSKQDEGDFNQAIANRLNIPIGKNPVVFVIKKNKGILENLIDWFSNNENTRTIDGYPVLFDVPALIIDDEADAASVNASKSIEEIKTINRLIRTLITLFNQNTFIGYTATPYANLFIPQEYNEQLETIIKNKKYKIGRDLFPNDFIINIKAANNYIGAAKIFGLEDGNERISEPLDIFRKIDDYDPPFFKTINKSNRDQLPEKLPDSLETAILSYILTCAIRRLRGHDKKHNSMLIHVALLVKWIDRVAYLVNDKLRSFSDRILSEDEDIIDRLKAIYVRDFIPTTRNILDALDYKDIRIEEHAWASVKAQLKASVQKIEVRAVHGTKSLQNLDYHNIEEIDYDRYENGLSVIAVGGSRLSRGITLEGLSISYYIRTTKMYDSLMQMGRWFGYRPGYVDLCRIFTTEEIFGWFTHITMATEEMRNDFDEMTALHKRPKDFKLKVRNHPGLLTITSLAKLNFSKNIEISFAGSNIQTYQLLKQKQAIINNFKSFKALTENLGFPKEENITRLKNGKLRYFLYRDAPVEELCAFLDSFITEQPTLKNAAITDYIRAQKERKNIKEWNIGIISNTDSQVFIDYEGGTAKDKRKPNKDVKAYELKIGNHKLIIGCSVRNQQYERDSASYYISRNQIDGTSERGIDLDSKAKALKEIKQERAAEKKGLLLIYSLDDRAAPGAYDELPIIGFSIYFPNIENEEKVSYTATIYDSLNDSPMEDDDNEEE
ncbi:MAG: Z1 domain-containing protein [Sphingobacterium sp.]